MATNDNFVTVTNDTQNDIIAKLYWNVQKGKTQTVSRGTTTNFNHATGDKDGWRVKLYDKNSDEFCECQALASTAKISVDAHSGSGDSQRYTLTVA